MPQSLIPMIPANHISLNYIDEVKLICRDFFKQTDINWFSFGRYYEDNSFITLCSEKDYCLHFFNNSQYSTKPIPSAKENIKQYYYLVQSDKKYSPIMYEARNHFQMDHAIALYYIFEGYYETFFFTSKPGNHQIINFYINNLDTLKQFIAYFKEQAAILIHNCEKTRLVFQERQNLSCVNLLDKLSKRENQCLQYLGNGRSAKEIGQYLNLSPRTIESYIYNLKHKLNCHTKSEVLDLLKFYSAETG